MTRSLSGYRPAPRYNGTPWLQARLEGSVNLVSWSEIETFDLAADTDPANPITRGFTSELVPDDVNWLRIVWIDETGPNDITDAISVVPTTAGLCTVQEVRARVGRELTDDEVAQVESLIGGATLNILAALGKSPIYAPAALVLPFLTSMCVELVARAFANPQALGQQSETLGQYSYTTTFARELPGSGLALTPVEERTLRFTVYGSNSSSSAPESLADVVAEAGWYLRDIIRPIKQVIA